MRVRKWLLPATACIALAAWPGAEAARSVSMVSCERFVISPAYTTDGTAYCAGLDLGPQTDRLRLYMTTDHARTWSETAAAGVVVGNNVILTELAISPAFASDRMLTVQLAGVTYVSTDSGASFMQVPVLSGRITLDTVDVGGITAAAHGVIVGASGVGSPGARVNYVFDPVVPGVRVVAGSGTGRDVAFVLRPAAATVDRAAFVVAASGDTPKTTTHTLYSCDATLSCTTKLATLPPAQRFDQAWFAADFLKSGTVFITTADAGDRMRAYVSHDRGRTFALVPTLDVAVRQAYATGNRPMVVLTPGRAGSRTMFARVSVGTERRNPPAEQLFRSDDNGKRWRLVAYGRSPYSYGPRGSMPYSFTYAGGSGESTAKGLLTFAPDGRLLMSGRVGSAYTVWCSADSGRAWRVSCR